MKIKFSEIIIAFGFWALLIIRFGYAFGTGDHAEFVPYALKIADNTLYAEDLFIQKLAENPVNERYFFCSLLSLFSSSLALVCFTGHLLFTVLMIIGLLRICEGFIKNRFYSYAVIAALLIFSAGKLPGGATMYANSFLSDTVSHALGVWGFYYFIHNKHVTAALLLSVATLMHPLIGLFVAVLTFGGYILHIGISKKMLPQKQFFAGLLIYIFTAGIYLILLASDQGKTLSSEAYYRIFFELRYPHHTLPSHFSKTGLFALVIFTIAGLLYFFKRQKTIFWFLLIQCIGYIIYYIGLEWYHVVEIGLTQWFRSSMWTYFFGLIALAAIGEKRIKLNLQPGKVFQFVALAFSIITFILVFTAPQVLPFGNTYEIGKQKYQNKEIEISQQIRNWSQEGTYILPFNFNAHKYYSRQSSYADYKTIPRKNANLGEWYRRMNLVYNLDTAHHLYGFKAEQNASIFYRNMPESRLIELKNEGVDYMVSDTLLRRRHLQLILNSEKYYVYKLMDASENL